MRYAVLAGVGGGSTVDRARLQPGLTCLSRLAIVTAVLLATGATAQAQRAIGIPDVGTQVEHGDTARPVAAWSDFCRRYPEDCAVDLSQPAVIRLTPALWRMIAGINRRVNTRIKAVTDMAHLGVVDRWDYPDDGVGDCEDIQLLKRKMLVERHLSRRAMLMTVVIDELGEGHAVLMVRTDKGDLILDNKTNAVLPWQRTGYAFVKREGQDSTEWVSLNNGASPVTTANR